MPWLAESADKADIKRKIHSGLLTLARGDGLSEFLCLLKRKFWWDYHAHWYVCNLSINLSSKTSPPIPNSFVVSHLSQETISWMKALDIPGLANRLEIENILAKKHLIYTLIVKDTIAGYLKIGKGAVYIPDFDQFMYVPKEEAFVMDTFIHNDFRGKKLFHFFCSEVKHDLHDKGFSKIHCHIRCDNLVSASAYRKNGFQQKGALLYKRRLWKRYLISPPNFFSDIKVSRNNC